MATKETVRVRRFLERPGISKMLLAEAANVSRRSFDRLGGDRWNPGIKQMERILAAISRLERAIDKEKGRQAHDETGTL